MKNLNQQLKLINDVFELRLDNTLTDNQKRFYIRAYCSLMDGVCNVFNLEMWEVIEYCGDVAKLDEQSDKIMESQLKLRESLHPIAVEQAPLYDAHVEAYHRHQDEASGD